MHRGAAATCGADACAEGVDRVAEVGNRGSAVWCEGAGGAASVCGTGRGRRTIPVVAVEVKGFFAGTAECAAFFEREEELLRSESPTSAKGLDFGAEVGNR